ncbi:MAG: 30S ribosomal protein S4 [Candidatus Omnitrophota bacterium]
MGRYVGAKCRLCRRAGMKLFIKGARCVMEKCAFAKRPVPPGMQSTRRPSKPTYYALQLKEKQKVKRMYGMLEKQFKRFFMLANKSKGVTGRVLIQFLERRLDNIIFRSIFASSRNQARQIVRHGFVFVDGKRADIPSYIVKAGQIIEIRAKESLLQNIRENIEVNSKERSVASWIEVDNDKFKIEIKRLPEKEDLVIPVDEQLIVELYSK